MPGQGDTVTRTTTRGTETVLLPGINFLHLSQVQIDASNVKGFHVLPAGVIITSGSTIALPLGSVSVVDRNGTAVPAVQVWITPRKVPVSPWDTLEAQVEVRDGSGVLMASVPHKTFFPLGWVSAQVQEAIFTAFIDAYQGGQGPIGRLVGRTPAGVIVELFVKGTVSATGTRLKEIATGHPRPGQTLSPSQQP
jgi:hypothetical protein